MTEQEIAAKEKQQVPGQEKTRAGRFFLPGVDIYEFDETRSSFGPICRE